MSDFKQCKAKSHAKDWLIFPENIGKQLAIDEVALSKGELYTIITNKKAKGKAGSIVAIIAGTKAYQVTDRFHLQKLASDALQDIRIKHRWEAIDKENQEIKEARNNGKTYIPKTFTNDDSLKQLLARSRYLLNKPKVGWTEKQQQRATILFENYPDIRKAYKICQKLRNMFNHKNISKQIAYTKLAH